jgi:AbrB family looped-hinge helix DNA binding protein
VLHAEKGVHREWTKREGSLPAGASDGNPFVMSITITLGKAGRLVVPKAIRESLGLREGSRLRLEVQGGRLEAVPEADELQIVMRAGFPVIEGAPPLKEGDIVRAIKSGRSAREERVAPGSRSKRR